jgi:hypothetical protein
MAVAGQIPFVPCGADGAINSFIMQQSSAALTVGQTYLIPPGAYINMPAANIVVELQDPATTWTTFYAASTGGEFHSDGTNMRIRATGSGTYNLLRYR